MNKTNRRAAIAALALFGTLTVRAADTLALIVPAGADQNPGNADMLWPFVASGPVRFQQWFHNGLFPQGLVKITGMTLRPNVQMGGKIDVENTSFLIRFSTTRNAANAPGQTFASNLGDDLATVKSGTMRVTSDFAPAENGTMAFDVKVAFDTPFVFDTTSGRHLILDLFNEFGSNPATAPPACLLPAASGPTGCNLDAQAFPDSDTAMLRRWRSDAGDGTLATGATAAVSDARGFVVRFDYEISPAPVASSVRRRPLPAVSRP